MDERDIFIDVIQSQDPARAAARLQDLCGENVALRQRVEDLLEAHGRAESFLEQPVAAVAANSPTLINQPPIEAPGTQIGPYKLREQIGEGGMGVVYVAEQTEPIRRRVALKIVKPGMDTRDVLARFEAERQALAMMNHPHIAKILDGGATATGRPYFVMELVKGVPITELCDQQKLSVRQRLELFILVCQAVQHAHQKGIIHRDLKPSNVMVELHDVTPVPKVIDFGIAKAISQPLSEHTVYTQYAQLVGTPLYMSPEQAQLSALDIDTRSDVYSLGVLLYELLTGATPFDQATLTKGGLEEMRRIIREVEPLRPSHKVSTLCVELLSTVSEQRQADARKLSLAIARELDWVVMKTLEKDRSRRYESASALAADLQRYLADEPVLACPPSMGYRFGKYAKKHRVALTTTALVGLSLLSGTGISVWQAVRATQAQTLAKFNESQAIAAAKAETAARQAEATQRQRAEDSEREARDRVVEVERQRNAVSENLYVADLRLGAVDWDSGNIERLSNKLLSHIPQVGENDRRGWEWYHLLGLCHQDERTLMHHSKSVSSVAWSPDGRYLASASFDATVSVVDSSSGMIVRTYPADNWAMGISWSPDSQRLAWGTTGRGASVWVADVQSDEIRRFPGHTGSVWVLAWRPDGQYLASAGIDHTLRIIDTTSGASLHVFENLVGNVYSLVWNPDGRRLASASGAGALRG